MRQGRQPTSAIYFHETRRPIDTDSTPSQRRDTIWIEAIHPSLSLSLSLSLSRALSLLLSTSLFPLTSIFRPRKLLRDRKKKGETGRGSKGEEKSIPSGEQILRVPSDTNNIPTRVFTVTRFTVSKTRPKLRNPPTNYSRFYSSTSCFSFAFDCRLSRSKVQYPSRDSRGSSVARDRTQSVSERCVNFEHLSICTSSSGIFAKRYA